MKPLHSLFAVILFFSFNSHLHAAIVDIFIDFAPIPSVANAPDFNPNATASLNGTFDDETGELNFTINYSGLTLNNTGLVFHGPVDALLNAAGDPMLDSLGNPLPNTDLFANNQRGFGNIANGSSEQFTVINDESGVLNLNESFKISNDLTVFTDILLGFWYVDLHTDLFPGAGGELKGHINVVESPVPLPAAAWLFATALGGLGFLRRQKSTI